MLSDEGFVITCVITGATKTPTMSEFLPITADQNATMAVAADQTGASASHVHARDAFNGDPAQAPKAFACSLPRMNHPANRPGGSYDRSAELRPGASQSRIKAQAATMGRTAGVRVDDSLWAGNRRFTKSNAGRVALAYRFVEGSSKVAAAPAEVQEILGTKRGDILAS
jgi:uncharacterized protein (DUF849 family)